MTDLAGQALADRLTGAERERRWPTVRPKDAATLIILDRGGAEPKVLMGRRHAGHRFMPGKFVFPGGRIEPEDRGVSAVGALSARAVEALMARTLRPSPARGPSTNTPVDNASAMVARSATMVTLRQPRAGSPTSGSRM